MLVYIHSMLKKQNSKERQNMQQDTKKEQNREGEEIEYYIYCFGMIQNIN